MSYYDIYYNRINKYGNSMQERIQNKREADFLTFMSKSPNKVSVFEDNAAASYDGVLETKTYDEDEVINYLLVPTNKTISFGSVLETQDIRHSNRQVWINLAVDPYATTGYNRYTLVELESMIYWVYEGVPYSCRAHATGGGSGARDKNVNLKFNTQFSESGVFLPNKRFSIIIPTNSAIKKGTKITLGGETWKVSGFDSISIQGVSYLTMEEALFDEEDYPYANHDDLYNWNIESTLGSSFELQTNSSTPVEFLVYYNSEQKAQDVEVTLPSAAAGYLSYNNGIFTTGESEYSTTISVKVPDVNESLTEFSVTVSSLSEEGPSISAPKNAKVTLETSCQIYGGVEDMVASSLNGYFDVVELTQEEGSLYNLIIRGRKIGNDKIVLKKNNAVLCEKDIAIVSLWMGE